MRELNVAEVEMVSGAGFLSGLTSAILGGTFAAAGGALVGGKHGGDGGGLLGFGIIGQGVGMVVGGVGGAIAGAVGGMIIGWDQPDTVSSLVTQFITSVTNGNFV